MKKSIVSLFVFLAGFGIFTTSCEDMLTPDMDRYAENFNGNDTVNFYLGIMRNVQEMVEQNVILAEIRADLADTTMYSSDSLARIARYDASLKDGESALLNRAAYYKVINQCNFYLAAADSMAVKNDNYFMRKEIAQVHMVRAWVYMQLVQLYGKVPFITRPVDNANTGWEVNPAEGWVEPETLLDALWPSLEQAVAYEKIYGFPNYGSFSTGKSSVTIPHKLMLFPSDLIMGDLYLLRGASVSDYEKAALHYYTWLDENGRSGVKNGNAAMFQITDFNEKVNVFPNPAGWFKSLVTYAIGGETVVAIPSAANASFGNVLTNPVSLYGFKVSSSNSTNAEGESVATSGEINITPDARLRQIGASNRYQALNAAQIYVNEKRDGLTTKVNYHNIGDARFYGTVPDHMTSEHGYVKFMHKFGPAQNANVISANMVNANGYVFNYEIPVYRMRQIYLRFAEAINRAGYPNHAFAVLRDGINYDKFPKFEYSVEIDSLNPDLTKSYYDDAEDVLHLVYTGTFTPDTVHQGENTMHITPYEMLRAQNVEFLRFDETQWANVGVHSMGCGTFTSKDTMYVYSKVVGERVAALKARYNITDEPVEAAAKKARDIVIPDGIVPGDTLIEIGDTIYLPLDKNELLPNQLEIEAVETLIADEMALETAFEGYRFFDLTRMARHKNKSNTGVNGTEWLAWMISSRSTNKAPFAPLEDGETEEKDMNLYNLLLNEQNWYLPNPQY